MLVTGGRYEGGAFGDLKGKGSIGRKSEEFGNR